MSRVVLSLVTVFAGVCLAPSHWVQSLWAQQVSVGTPSFGGFNPWAGATIGSARRWGNGELSFNLSAAQGFMSTEVMAAPSLTVTNGVPGSIQDVSLRPFVTGLIPVVGGTIGPFPFYPYQPYYAGPRAVVTNPLYEKFARLRYNPAQRKANRVRGSDLIVRDKNQDKASSSFVPVLASRSASSAERGDVGVAEIRRLQAVADTERQQELDRIIAEAQVAEQQGRMGIARVRYLQAAAKTDGEHREELLQAAARLMDR